MGPAWGVCGDALFRLQSFPWYRTTDGAEKRSGGFGVNHIERFGCCVCYTIGKVYDCTAWSKDSDMCSHAKQVESVYC